MQELLPEILCLIFQHLSVIDWLSACRVNSTWRREGLHVDQLKRRGWPSYASLKRSHHMICCYCSKNKAMIRHTTGIRECTSCRSGPGRKLVTRTTAIRILKMKPAQLDRVPVYLCPNPHPSKHCMKLYRLADLTYNQQPMINHLPHTHLFRSVT